MSPEALDALNSEISARALQEGFATVLTTRLRNRTVLRICAIHPDATESDMRETIQMLSSYADAVLASGVQA